MFLLFILIKLSLAIPNITFCHKTNIDSIDIRLCNRNVYYGTCSLILDNNNFSLDYKTDFSGYILPPEFNCINSYNYMGIEPIKYCFVLSIFNNISLIVRPQIMCSDYNYTFDAVNLVFNDYFSTTDDYFVPYIICKNDSYNISCDRCDPNDIILNTTENSVNILYRRNDVNYTDSCYFSASGSFKSPIRLGTFLLIILQFLIVIIKK